MSSLFQPSGLDAVVPSHKTGRPETPRVSCHGAPDATNVASALLAIAARVEQQDRQIRAALREAAKQKDTELVRRLIEAWEA